MVVRKRSEATSAFYVSNDAKMLGKFIEDDWSVPIRFIKKPVIQYSPDRDVDSFDYSQGEVLCFITADDMRKTPKGIGFDGYSQNRLMRIRLRGMNNDAILTVSDEIERILNRHAINPGNGWNLMTDFSDSPLYPFRKFVQRDIIVTLICYWKPRLEAQS